MKAPDSDSERVYIRAEYDRGVYRANLPGWARATGFRAVSADGRVVEVRCERRANPNGDSTIEVLYRPMFWGREGWTFEPVDPADVPAIQRRMAEIEAPFLPSPERDWT